MSYILQTVFSISTGCFQMVLREHKAIKTKKEVETEDQQERKKGKEGQFL